MLNGTEFRTRADNQPKEIKSSIISNTITLTICKVIHINYTQIAMLRHTKHEFCKRDESELNKEVIF